MAHEVESIEGQIQMAYAGDTPWHGLGVKVSNDLSPEQMMKKAGLDWSVEKRPMYFGDNIEIPGKQALVRSTDNKVLDVVGTDWNPVQNQQAFEFFSEYVMAGDMEMHTAGSLFDGKRIWSLAKIKDSFDVLPGDKVDSYLLFSNPHKYGSAIDVRFTPIRVVCNNTLSYSLSSKSNNAVKVGHRSEFNPEMVKEQLGIAHDKFAQYKEISQFLASKKFSVDGMLEFYSTVFKGRNEVVKTIDDLSRPARQAYDVLETQPGAQYAEGTFWQLINSVTYHTDHVASRTSDRRLESAWFGMNASRKNKAMDKAIELANAA